MLFRRRLRMGKAGARSSTAGRARALPRASIVGERAGASPRASVAGRRAQALLRAALLSERTGAPPRANTAGRARSSSPVAGRRRGNRTTGLPEVRDGHR
jgi:hypothetical protein